jgi:hypothetical protein
MRKCQVFDLLSQVENAFLESFLLGAAFLQQLQGIRFLLAQLLIEGLQLDLRVGP